MRNVILLCACAALPAFAAPSEKGAAPLWKGWLVQPVAIPANQPLDRVVPFDKSDAKWKPGDFEKNPPQAEGAKKGNRIEGDYACWYRKGVFVPAEAKGRSVTLDFGLLGADAVVFVNGRRAGVAPHPDGWVEISPFAEFGRTNRVEVFVTNRGFGTGDGPVAYYGRDDQNWPMLGISSYGRRIDPVALRTHTPVRVTDVRLDCSWRKKTLGVTVEAEALEGTGAFGKKLDLVLSVLEDRGRDAATGELRSGRVVKTGGGSFKLEKGRNVLIFEIPWPDVECWEAVPNPKVYDWELVAKVGKAVCDAPAKQVFGFREIWREGKEIMMNGHVQRFRGWWGSAPKELGDIHRWGFNLSYCTHQHIAPFWEKADEMEARTRAGVCKFTGMPPIYFCNTDNIRRDPNCRAQWLRYVERWARSCRNYPCVVGASCGVNMICPERNMRPEFLGQSHEDGGVAQNIEYAVGLVRDAHYSNCLYFSHADGTEADISSSNLYFNFTPLQEREDWLSQWATNGILPWYAAEFGAPYKGCWFHARTPQFTEWMAAYYGNRAYETETDEALAYAKELSYVCRRRTHGAEVNGKGAYELNPICREYTRMLVYRTNRAWRTFGLNGGIMYLYQWPWDDADWQCQAYSQANGDIIAFIGGEDSVTDRTHAYWSGDEVRKTLVLQWDGPGQNEFTVVWRLVNAKDGSIVTSGTVAKTLKRGEICRVPLAVRPPAADKARASYRLEATFDARRGMTPQDSANWTCHTDAVQIDVYPPFKAIGLGAAQQVGLFDPAGETAEALTALGVAFTRFGTLPALVGQACTNRNPIRIAIVGKNALANAEGLQRIEPAVAKGLRLMVMPQPAEVWGMLGFQAEDSMARQMFAAGLPGVDDTDLHHWAGEPRCAAAFGNVMAHETRRGPRGTHHHAIAAMPLLVPQRGGFVPLVRGEFDMSYSALLKLAHGRGAAYFCAFDFEGRVGEKGCPAATKVAVAAFTELQRGRVQADRRVLTDGKAAKRIADALGLDSEAYRSDEAYKNALVILGGDSRLRPSDLAKVANEKSNRLAVFGNEAYVAALGGVTLRRPLTGESVRTADGQVKTDLTETPAYRLSSAKDRFWDLYRSANLFPGLFRSRDGFLAPRIVKANPQDRDWRVSDLGYAARYRDTTYIETPDPFAVCDRYRKEGFKTEALKGQGWGSSPKTDEDLYLRNAAQSEDNSLRRLSLLFADWGVPAGAKVFRRALYTKPYEMFEPVAQYNVLGPFPCPVGDNSEYMVDTVDFPVEAGKGGMPGKYAEEMAVAGDVQPNPRFHPQHLTYLESTPQDLRFLDWRPVVKSAPNGLVNLRDVPLIASQSFQTSYAVGFLPRETDGEITVRFGVDWRGKLWVNGKELAKTYGQTKDEGSIIVEHVKVWAKPKNLSGEALQAFDKAHGTFDGKNVITVKAGSGQSAATFFLRVTKEVRPGEVRREEIAELKDVDLYESANPGFDPYEYVYW